MPRVMPKVKRTTRITIMPASAPARPVARPSCQLPGGSQSGTGYHTGQGYSPAGRSGGTTDALRQRAARSTEKATDKSH